MFRPEGVYPAMLTPFNDDGTPNLPELRRISEFGIQKGLMGLFPVSSIGEGVHMSFEEKCACMDAVIGQAAGRVPVTPGVVASTPQESVRLAAHAAKAGASGVVLTPPFYYKPGQPVVERFFEYIIERVELPVILYNIPMFASPVGYDTVKRLVRYKNVVGMKDSSGSLVDFLHFMDKIRIAGESTNMLTGREEMLLSTLVMGGKGCMTATAGILPEVMVGIWDKYHAGDMEGARKLQEAVLVIIRTMFAVEIPVGFKLAMELRGFKMGPPRLPLSHADAFQVTTVRSRLRVVLEPLLKSIGAETRWTEDA